MAVLQYINYIKFFYELLQVNRLFLVGCFTCAPDSFELVIKAHGTDLRVGGFIAKWRNLGTGKKLYWS